MPWTYHQRTGRLFHDQTAVAKGYSGSAKGINNPGMEHVRNVGPIPHGKYSIGAQYDTTAHGPHVMALSPIGHTALGRTEFLIHGDNVAANQTASQGCIILPRHIRDRIARSGDKVLNVVP